MSDCEKYIEMISAILDGELDKEQEAELRTHIETCDECKRVYKAFAGISEALGDDLVEPPEMLAENVMHKIRQKNNGVSRNHFYFGRFTAIAACFVLVMLSAFHFGLFGGTGTKTAMSAAAPKTAETQNTALGDASSGSADTYSAAVPETSDNGNVTAEGKAAGSSAPKPFSAKQVPTPAPTNEQQLMTASAPGTEKNENGEFQYGFPSLRMAITNPDSDTSQTKQPYSLYEATSLTLYGGKYYAAENDKNNLLVTVSDENKLVTLTGLLTAVSDSDVDYTKVDSKFTESDPSYTVFVPVDKTSDEGASDEIIDVWFVKGETWCVLEDADANNGSSDNVKVLYKAAGLQTDFEKDVKQLENK